ncbi:ABC transporter permease [Anaerobacillus sp. CMMVII]|uniref:multidrug ABC transporter permease n=1 Tax=Anaerobacillus sp. CMMVII TaxID=2755588 RepID=UPI0021B6EA14|nr:multidrug ABC transporter permease [Anaerobacillus sp. CMMVII]MCT8137206.1 ABC transporter permease [Anaerobacillus sp. CMMVII]
MQLKTYLFNRGIFTQSVRNVGWIGIAYVLCLWFALPLQILMISSNQKEYKLHYAFVSENLFRFSDPFQIFMIFIVPVLLAIFLFRYMQVKLSSDYIHSLPIKRSALFHQNLLIGIIMLVVPVLITGFSLLILSSFVEAPTLLNLTVIGQWAGQTILLSLFVFMAAVFVGMFTGSSVLQGSLTYILFIMPAGMTVLFFMNVKYFLHGFATDYYLSNQMSNIVPYIKAAELGNTSLTMSEVVAFILVTIVFYMIALFAYSRRKVESATHAIAFRPLQPVFLYGVTVCSMLLGGMYFGETQGTMGWRIFGYIVTSIIGYFVALMILEKSWRVLTKWRGYSIFTAFMIILALLIKLDVTGYENRIPNADNIERVYMADSIYMLEDRHSFEEVNQQYQEQYYYKEAENIENILNLHKQIVESQGRFDYSSGFYRRAYFVYELENGKKLVRQYRVPETFYSEPNEYYSKVLESHEHKWNANVALRITDSNLINKITITPNRGMKQLTIFKREDIESFHQTFQKELKETSNEDLRLNNGTWGTIEYLMKGNQWLYSDWKKIHEEVEAWLIDRDLLKQARLTAEEVEFAVVIKKDREYLYEYNYSVDFNEFANRTDAIRIDRANEIEAVLKVRHGMTVVNS